jgi:hypothetical protein
VGFLREVRLRKMPASPPPPLPELLAFLASTAGRSTLGGAAAFFDGPAVRVAGGVVSVLVVVAAAGGTGAASNVPRAAGASVCKRAAGAAGLVERFMLPKASMEIFRPIVRGGAAFCVGAAATEAAAEWSELATGVSAEIWPAPATAGDVSSE